MKAELAPILESESGRFVEASHVPSALGPSYAACNSKGSKKATTYTRDNRHIERDGLGPGRTLRYLYHSPVVQTRHIYLREWESTAGGIGIRLLFVSLYIPNNYQNNITHIRGKEPRRDGLQYIQISDGSYASSGPKLDSDQTGLFYDHHIGVP